MDANTAQLKILAMIKKHGKNIRQIADERQLPYSTVREALKVPTRLNVEDLIWYANYFGVPTDYFLSETGDKTFADTGTNFRTAREGAEISLDEAQKMLGVSGCMLELVEQGEVDASVSLLKKAIEKYGVSPDFILGKTDSDVDFEMITTLLKDVRFLLTCQDIFRRPLLKTIFSKLRRLSDYELQTLTKVIDDIIEGFLKD